MSGICSELHYHGPDPVFVLAFVGFPARLCLSQMSRLYRLCILSTKVNNLTCNIIKGCGPFAHRHIDAFFCVWLCALFLPSPPYLNRGGFYSMFSFLFFIYILECHICCLKLLYLPPPSLLTSFFSSFFLFPLPVPLVSVPLSAVLTFLNLCVSLRDICIT